MLWKPSRRATCNPFDVYRSAGVLNNHEFTDTTDMGAGSEEFAHHLFTTAYNHIHSRIRVAPRRCACRGIYERLLRVTADVRYIVSALGNHRKINAL